MNRFLQLRRLVKRYMLLKATGIVIVMSTMLNIYIIFNNKRLIIKLVVISLLILTTCRAVALSCCCSLITAVCSLDTNLQFLS